MAIFHRRVVAFLFGRLCCNSFAKRRFVSDLFDKLKHRHSHASNRAPLDLPRNMGQPVIRSIRSSDTRSLTCFSKTGIALWQSSVGDSRSF